MPKSTEETKTKETPKTEVASLFAEKPVTSKNEPKPTKKPEVNILNNPEDKEKVTPSTPKTIKKPQNININKSTKDIYKKLLIPLIIIFLLVAGYIVYAMWFKSNGGFINPFPTNDSGSGENSSGFMDSSNMFESPINGMLFPKDQSRDFREKKPIAVMVNNYVVARPSAGISQADVVYEVVAEGGITRLMPIFHSRIPEMVSSIRSARYYFVQLASGYGAHYVHWGAAHQPPCQKVSPSSSEYCPRVNGIWETEPDVDSYDWIVKLGVPNLDGGNYPGCDNCAFDRDDAKLAAGIPTEHTALVRLPETYELAKTVRPSDDWHKYQEVVAWEFKDDAPLSERGDIGAVTPITYNYWDTMAGFNVKWEYDKENNNYLRYQGGTKVTDANDGSEIRAKTVIIRFTEQELVGDKKNHLYYELVGTGDALVFEDGKVIEAEWIRTNPDERDVYRLADGTQVEFVRGQIWVQVVPVGNTVSYQAAAQ